MNHACMYIDTYHISQASAIILQLCIYVFLVCTLFPLHHPPTPRLQCSSVSWSPAQRDLFVSSSWDDTAKLWSLASGQALRSFLGHTYCVYTAAW